MRRLVLCLVVLCVFLMSLVSAEIFFDEDQELIVNVYEDFFWQDEGSFKIYVTKLNFDEKCSVEVYDADFVSGFIFDDIFYFETVENMGDSITYMTNKMTISDCNIWAAHTWSFSVTSAKDDVECTQDSDCPGTEACVYDGSEGNFGSCVLCVDDDGGEDYGNPGTLQEGVWSRTGYYFEDGKDSCSSSDKLEEYYCSEVDGKTYAYYSVRSCSDLYGEDSECLDNEEGLGYCSGSETGTSVEDSGLERAIEIEEKDNSELVKMSNVKNVKKAPEEREIKWFNPLSWL